ncbi:MAG: redoxin family protein [Chloroflexi bacterium]|nr:redoxin family protein [Chloroflexota bacterium]
MQSTRLDPPHIRMPDFAPASWLNVDTPLQKQRLAGRSVLLHFWDYTCLDCIRSLDYPIRWHDRYHEHGLTIIGVHIPSFAFAQAAAPLEAIIDRYAVQYPVLLDNQFQNWGRFAVEQLPSWVLIDSAGYIRHVQAGLADTIELELAIQEVLRLQTPDLFLPDPLPLQRQEDHPEAELLPHSPELFAGFEKGALGIPQTYIPDHPMVYELPRPDLRARHRLYVQGIWRARPECLSFAGQDGGQVLVPYVGAGVHALLSPSDDPVDVWLNLRPAKDTLPVVEVWQDNAPLTPDIAGEDIEYDDGGVTVVHVDQPRLFELVNEAHCTTHELSLIFRATGLSLYSLSFSSRIKP